MLFTVTCPGCGTDFPVDRRKVPEDGVFAQCSLCPQIFWVDREMLAPAPTATVSVSQAAQTAQASPAAPTIAPPVPAPTAPTVTVPPPPPLATPPAAETPEALAHPIPAAPEAEPVASAPTPAPPRPVFGKQDPQERAARLARVLVSDMIAYYSDRHRVSLQNGTLASDFEEEIEKSWNEYVQQVGPEIARSTDHWRQALNQVLAKGDPVF